jgi:hypothetical protein
LVEVLGLSSPTGTNDERQKPLVMGKRTGTKGVTKGVFRKTKKKRKKPMAVGATHAPTPLPLAGEHPTPAPSPPFITIEN